MLKELHWLYLLMNTTVTQVQQTDLYSYVIGLLLSVYIYMSIACTITRVGSLMGHQCRVAISIR